MQIANDFRNQQTYGSNSVRNSSQSATDFALALKNSSPGVIELHSGAVRSGGTFIDGKAVSVSVYHSERYSPDNPVYTVKGKNTDGTPFEVEININNVDPRNANLIEMEALFAHLEASGQISHRAFVNPFMDVHGGNYSNPDAFTKADFLAPMKQMMNWQEANKNWEGYNQYKKLIDVLIDYIQKHKEQTELALKNINSNDDPLELLEASPILHKRVGDNYTLNPGKIITQLTPGLGF